MNPKHLDISKIDSPRYHRRKMNTRNKKTRHNNYVKQLKNIYKDPDYIHLNNVSFKDAV